MRYDDGRIACQDDALIIRWYYLWGAKTIPYSAIKSVTRVQMTALRGKGRIWGSGDFVHWWNLDPKRSSKQIALQLDLGHTVKPMISPDDPAAVEQAINDNRTG